MGVASICSTVLKQEMLAQFEQQTELNLKAFDDLETAHQWCQEQLMANTGK